MAAYYIVYFDILFSSDVIVSVAEALVEDDIANESSLTPFESAYIFMQEDFDTLM